MDHCTPTCPSCGRKNRVPDAAAGRPRCSVCHADLPWIVDATSATSFDRAVAGGLPVLVDLWAPWCGPCRTIAPAIERAAATYAGRLKVVKVNVDDVPAISERYHVRGIPTLLMLRDSAVVGQQVGALPERRLTAWIDTVVSDPSR